MKLAVLISGMWRNFEENWPINKKVLDDNGINYEIFFSTFRQNQNLQNILVPGNIGNKLFLGLKPKNYYPYLKAEISEALINKILGECTFEIREFSTNSITDRFQLANGNNRQAQINSISMYRGIEATLSLLEKSEYIHEFTHFLRMRTDYRLLSSKHWKNIWLSEIFFVGDTLDFGGIKVGDQCFGGRIEYSRLLLATEKYIIKLINSSGWQNNKENLMLGESILAGIIASANMNAKIDIFPKLGKLTRPDTHSLREDIKPDFVKSAIEHNMNVVKHQIKMITRHQILRRLMGLT